VVPPLRERREDIVAMAHWLLRSIGTAVGRRQVDLSADACRALESYPWPGNIRELRNVLERAVLLCDRDALEAKDLNLDRAAERSLPETSLTLAELERQHIERVLQEAGGNVPRAAVRLGIPRSTLYQRLKQLQIDVSRIRTSDVRDPDET